jgi:predicted acyltransferase
MIFVNELAGIADIPQWAAHMPADADAMSFVDVVFPAFLFIVGLSMPFAIQARRASGATTWQILTHGFTRAISLIVIGVFMVNSSSGLSGELAPLSTDAWTLLMYASVFLIWTKYPSRFSRLGIWVARFIGGFGLMWLWWIYTGIDGHGMTPQWWGILGLIGWAYAISLAVYLISQRVSWLLTALLVCVGTYLMLGPSGYFDSDILDQIAAGRGHLTHSAIVLAGIILAVLMYSENYASKRNLGVAACCAAAIVFAFATWQVSPISKIYASPSWGLFSITACLFSFLLLRRLLDNSQHMGWVRFVQPAAGNPLVFYLLPFVAAAMLGALSLKSRPELFAAGSMGVLWSVFFTVVIAIIGGWLTRVGIRLRL